MNLMAWWLPVKHSKMSERFLTGKKFESYGQPDLKRNISLITVDTSQCKQIWKYLNSEQLIMSVQSHVLLFYNNSNFYRII